jgi:DNA-binding transcriptional MerR regulator
MEKLLPAIPAKRYFTIGEVSDLCGVKPYVLRYWEQEFTQLKPMKRRGNRRYYQHHEVLLIRRIRELLYDQGFTISGARNRLTDSAQVRADLLQGNESQHAYDEALEEVEAAEMSARIVTVSMLDVPTAGDPSLGKAATLSADQVRRELISIRSLLAF